MRESNKPALRALKENPSQSMNSAKGFPPAKDRWRLLQGKIYQDTVVIGYEAAVVLGEDLVCDGGGSSIVEDVVDDGAPAALMVAVERTGYRGEVLLCGIAGVREGF